MTDNIDYEKLRDLIIKKYNPVSIYALGLAKKKTFTNEEKEYLKQLARRYNYEPYNFGRGGRR